MIRIRQWIEKYQNTLINGINNPPPTPPPTQLIGPPPPPGSNPPGPSPPPPGPSGPPPNKRDTPDSSRDEQREPKRQIRSGQFDESQQELPSTPISTQSRDDGKMAFEEHDTEDHDQDFSVEDDEMASEWSDCASEVVNVSVPPIYVKLLIFLRLRISPVAFALKMCCITIW